MKKFLSLVLVLSMVLSIVPYGVVSAYDKRALYDEYTKVLDTYVYDYNSGDEEGVYYALVDINDDGIEEFIIGFGGSMGFALYSYDNNRLIDHDYIASDVVGFYKQSGCLYDISTDFASEPNAKEVYINKFRLNGDRLSHETVFNTVYYVWDGVYTIPQVKNIIDNSEEIELIEATDRSAFEDWEIPVFDEKQEYRNESLQFVDVSSDTPYVEAIMSLANRGVINGYEDGTFRPENTVTRAEAATILARAFYDTWGIGNQFTPFYDVAKDMWCSGYVNMMVNEGIINGMGDGTFRPNAEVTYGQIVKMIVCAVDYGALAEQWGGYNSGAYNTVASWLGITNGVEAYFNTPMTRGQVAQLIHNAFQIEKQTDLSAWGETYKKYGYFDVLSFTPFCGYKPFYVELAVGANWLDIRYDLTNAPENAIKKYIETMKKAGYAVEIESDTYFTYYRFSGYREFVVSHNHTSNELRFNIVLDTNQPVG